MRQMARRAQSGTLAAGACAIALGLACLVALWAQGRVRAQVYASGFSSPVAFVQDPLDRSVQFVVEQVGRIRVVRSGTVLTTDFLDLRGAVLAGGERGLLGLAFAPDAASGRFFVNFTDRSGDTVVARFRRSADPLVANPTSRFDLRFAGVNGPAVIAQPFSNHNGGHLAFGPDGFLYIGLGDGGSGDDPDHRAQNPQELLGKMLRIDVSVADTQALGYQVPADNPFVGGRPIAARAEIWAFGLRNPWRYSFDDPARGGTGALVIGDVGQNAFEEVDYEPPNRGGRNYGWRNREGAHDNVTSRPPAYLPLVDPIHEYGRASGQSITGGYVYRGRSLGASYVGRYFFADYVQGRVWSLALAIDSQGEAHVSDLMEHTADLGGQAQLGNISSFGVDADGELYIVSLSRGVVLRVGGLAPPTPTDLRVIR
jgi:glucose/arabinose dehydrogenase